MMIQKLSSACIRLARPNQFQNILPKVKISNVPGPQRRLCSLAEPPSGLQGGKLPEKIRKAQEKFQEPNDIPVFLKGGKLDLFVYWGIVGLCVVGVASSFQQLYKMAFKN